MKEGGSSDKEGRCATIDIVKVARYTNLVVSIILIVMVVFNFVNLGKAAFNPFDWIMVMF